MVTSPLLGCVVRKVAVVEDRLCIVDVERQYHCGGIFSRYVNLAYNSISPLGLSLWSPFEFN